MKKLDFNKKIDPARIKTWFVTGASSGFGKLISEALLARGYNVVATSIVAPEIRHPNALSLVVDVTKQTDVTKGLAAAVARFGRVDVLFNSAGITANFTVEESPEKLVRQVFEINYWGTYHLAKTFIRHFRENKNGTFAAITSQSGIAPRKFGVAYCGSKYAMEALLGALTIECREFARIIAVEPGFFGGTDIITNALHRKTRFAEYQRGIGTIENDCPDCNRFHNVIAPAVRHIIDIMEMAEPPRHLIIGREAHPRLATEIAYFTRDNTFMQQIDQDCYESNASPPKARKAPALPAGKKSTRK